MSLIYKDNPTTKVEIKLKNNKVKIRFEADCGKFGTFEDLAFFNLTPDRLLEVLDKEEDYTDEELED